MARETEILLMGGLDQVVQPDALDGFAGSPEVGVTMRIRTKRHLPLGPASELVGKRLFVQVEYSEGVTLSVTPIVDSQSQPILTRHFSRPGWPGEAKRESFLIPLWRPVAGGAFSVGLRGTSFGAILETTMPPSGFHLESLQLEASPLQIARGRKEGE
jgi:hypothetical protein